MKLTQHASEQGARLLRKERTNFHWMTGLSGPKSVESVDRALAEMEQQQIGLSQIQEGESAAQGGADSTTTHVPTKGDADAIESLPPS